MSLFTVGRYVVFIYSSSGIFLYISTYMYMNLNILYDYNIDSKCDYIVHIFIITLIIATLHVIVYRKERQLWI